MIDDLRKNLIARKEIEGRSGRFGSNELIEKFQLRPNLSK